MEDMTSLTFRLWYVNLYAHLIFWYNTYNLYNDINFHIGHPNVKVFITQGGLQSAEEAIVKGVPVVGIPFIADQPRNVAAMVQHGLGVKVDAETLTRDVLKNAILEVAGNDK